MNSLVNLLEYSLSSAVVFDMFISVNNILMFLLAFYIFAIGVFLWDDRNDGLSGGEEGKCYPVNEGWPSHRTDIPGGTPWCEVIRWSDSKRLSTVLGASICDTVYPKKYALGFVVLCFVVVMQSFIMNSHEVFIHIHQGCFAGTGAIVRLPQCQWSKPDGYGKISQCITTTKHSKAKTLCIFLGIYCIWIIDIL